MRRLLALVAVACAVAAGCGGAENEPNLAEAAERTEAQGTGRIALSGVEKSDEESASFTCDGDADYEAKRVRIDCEYQGDGEFDMVGIGNDVFVRGRIFGAKSDKWMKVSDEADDERAFSSLSPETLLGLLRAASSETERLGDEEIRGEPTVGYRLTVDCDAAELSCPIETHVEVWIGDDGVVRRIELEDDNGNLTFEFFDFGAEVDIQAPSADEVVDEDQVFESSGGGASAGPVVCVEGDAKPITRERALSTLRRHGFSMRGDSQSCFVSNASGAATDVLAREGIVHCSIQAEPSAGAPKTTTRRGADGADAELALANVTCTIFTDSPTGEEKIDRLETAFDELERAIRP